MKGKRIYIAAAILFIGLVGLAWAIVPPPPVNQNIGIKDTRLDKLSESDCRNCHNTTFLGGVPTRHHYLPSSGAINPATGNRFICADCHPIVSTPNGGTLFFDRNCIACHNGTAFYANQSGVNITKPHHIDTGYDQAGIGQPAQTRQCKVCHGSFIDNFNDSHYIPSYGTSFMITPYADYKVYNATSGRYWGGCRACHYNDSTNILNNHDTHHGAIRGFGTGHSADKTPGSQCSWCHVINTTSGSVLRIYIDVNGVQTRVMEVRNSTVEQGSIMEDGTTNVSINGTGCEKCHSVDSIHRIQYNYSQTNGQLGYGHIGNGEWDCNGCHASWDAGSLPLGGAAVPYIDSVTPSVILANTAATLTIEGGNFLQESFTTTVSVNGVSYNPTTLTDSEIVVDIPGLNAGVYPLYVIVGPSQSKLYVLTVVTQVTITSAKLSSGVLTITGAGFGADAQEAVTIEHAGEVFYSDSITSWSNTQIVATSARAVVGDVVTVTTGSGSASATIEAGTSITVTVPNGGESWKHGTQHEIKWTSAGNPGANVKIELLKGTSVNRVIVSSTANDGSYMWTIPGGQTPATNYKIRITSTSNPQYSDTSDNYFTIVT